MAECVERRAAAATKGGGVAAAAAAAARLGVKSMSRGYLSAFLSCAGSWPFCVHLHKTWKARLPLSRTS